MIKTFKYSVFSLSLLLAACGGGGGDSTSPTPPPDASTPPTGSLNVDISGLPDNSAPSIVITGPDDFSTTLTGDATLDELAYGSYTVSIDAVSTPQGTFDSLPAELTIDVDGIETLSVLYQTPILSEGPIEGFGSVVVNGTRFDTSSATINTNEGVEEASTLDLGMVVSVTGRTTADGSVITAQQVDYYASAEGPITSISFGQNTFTVLGQTFNINNETRFIDRTFVELRTGDIVEVSAFGSQDQLIATRVEYYAQLDDDYDVSGRIVNLDTAAMTFSIGSLNIDYSSADVDGSLSNNVLVSVESSQVPVDNVLIADEVDVRGENSSSPSNGKVVREGLITELNGTQVRVNNREWFRITDTTNYVNGSSADLAVDVRITMRALNTDDGLVAERIVFIPANTINVVGSVTELDTSEIRVFSTEFDVNSTTQIVDMRTTPPQQIVLDAINLGDKVNVSGFYDYDGDLTARRIELTTSASGGAENAGELEFEGALESFTVPTADSSGSLLVNGLTIETAANTRFYLDESFVTSATFYEQLTMGDHLEMDAYLLDDRIVAYEVEKDMRDGSENNNTFEIEGAVTQALVDNEFVLTGLPVFINENTRYDDGNEQGLIEGAVVEVRAREDEEGKIIAIHIDFEPRNNDDDDDDSRNETEIEGRISNFDGSAQTFNINNQVVRFSNATDIENGAIDDLGNDVWVEVEGYFDTDGFFNANDIYIEEEREDELEGTITEIIDNNQFIVNGVTVEITSRTEFENGNRSNIVIGALVDIEGIFQNANLMRAREIEFEDK